MTTIVVVNREYLDRLSQSFESVRKSLISRGFSSENAYVKKCLSQIKRAYSECIEDGIVIPDVLYHHTSPEKAQRILAEGIRKSTDPTVQRVWLKKDKSLVPGVYLTRFPDHDRGREGYERRVEIRTDEMEPTEFMFDEDNVFLTPLHSLMNGNGTVAYLNNIPKEWILKVEENEFAEV